MRAVVTGGAGCVRSHPCGRLLDAGEGEVVRRDGFRTGKPERVAHLTPRPGFSLLRCDVREGIEVTGPVDTVLHVASPAVSVGEGPRRPIGRFAAHRVPELMPVA